MTPRQLGLSGSIAILCALLASCFCAVVLAAPAHAYPEDSCSIDIAPTEVAAGGTLTVSGTATGDRSWTVSFAGETKTATGSEFTLEFTAPQVESTSTFEVRVASDPARSSVTLAGCTATYEVTVLAAVSTPPSTGSGSDLPDTGGPELGWLLLALALLLAGSVAVRIARRGESPTAE